jgi:hypothetical protein
VVELAENGVVADLLFAHSLIDEPAGFTFRPVAPIDLLRLKEPDLFFDPTFKRCGHGESFPRGRKEQITQAAPFVKNWTWDPSPFGATRSFKIKAKAFDGRSLSKLTGIRDEGMMIVCGS